MIGARECLSKLVCISTVADLRSQPKEEKIRVKDNSYEYYGS